MSEYLSNAEDFIDWVRGAATELETAHQALDQLDVPRRDETGRVLVLAARIQFLNEVQ